MKLVRNPNTVWCDAAIASMAFGLVGVSLLRKIFDSDIWFHMVVGREVVRQMKIPDVEFYVLTRLGEPGEFHEWGFGVLYYFIEQWSGYVGMAMANAAIGCGILLLLYLAGSAESKSGLLKLFPVIGLVLWVIELRMNFRPETWLYVMLASEIFLLEKYLLYRTWYWLAPLPLLAWALSLGHPSALFLIGVFGVYSIQAMLTSAQNKFRITAVLGGVALAMAGGALLNPYGLHQLLLPFYFRNDALISSLTEDLPVLQTEYALHFVIIVSVGFLAILSGKQKRFADILLACMFTILTYKYARNIALLGIVMFVPIAHALVHWSGRFVGYAGKALNAVAVAVGLAGLGLTAASPLWGTGLYEPSTPIKSSELIRKYVHSGNTLNFLHLGNYLAWDLDRPVFIDGRNYGSNRGVQLHDAIFRADPGWQNAILDFNIEAIVTPVTLDYSGQIIPLVAHLASDPDWVLIAQEKAGLLFLRSPVPDGIQPLLKQVIWKHAVEELTVNLATYPDSKESYQSLATAYGQLGDVAKAQYFSDQFSSLSK
ncbi:MAG: hypothetical protein WA632_13000 [Gallionella sp.]